MLDHPAQSDSVHGSGLVALPLLLPRIQKSVDHPGIGYFT